MSRNILRKRALILPRRASEFAASFTELPMSKNLLAPLAAAGLAACSAAPTASAEVARAATRTLIVTGAGEVSGAPDMALLSVGVETRAPNAAAALKENAMRMNATIARLKARGVAEKDMQTANLSVGPQYKYDNTGNPPQIVGYQATNMLNVKLRDLAAAGSIIDEAVADGANSLGGLSFTFSDSRHLEDAAREAAVADARAKAQLLAKSAGVTLGPVLQIQDGFAAPPIPGPVYDVRAMSAEAKSTPVSVGESSVSANVTLVYEIR